MTAGDEQGQATEGHGAGASGAAVEVARTAARLRAYARLATALADELEAAAGGDAPRRAAASAEREAAEAALVEATAADGEARQAGADDAMRDALAALEREAQQRAQEELLAGLAARARARTGGIDPRVPAWSEYLPPAHVAGQLDVRR